MPLSANLRALARRDPALAARLARPTRVDHAGVRPDGVGWLQVGSQRVALRVPPERLPAGDAEGLLVFGAGLGEAVESALAGGPVLAWERDPHLLRLLLARRDWSGPLVDGRLRLLLGADLLDAPSLPVWRHPVLAAHYWREDDVLARGPGPRLALVVAGGLFVDDVTRALHAEGWRAWTWDVAGLSAEELAETARKLDARLVVAINHVPGLAEATAALGLPLSTWEIDPAIDRVRPLTAPAPDAAMFTFRRRHVPLYADAGFPVSRFLPLAADPARRRPLPLTDEERARFGGDVAFVGSSCVAPARRHRATLQADLSAGLGLPDVPARLDRVFAEQRRDLATWRVPALLAEAFPGLDRLPLPYDPAQLAGEVAAAEKRLSVVASLGRFGARVWGDSGWQALAPHGVTWMGQAGHHDALTRIYNAARVHVDIGRLYQQDIVTMRVFDVLACGGFVLAEHSEGLGELFQLGVELDTWRTVPELVEKVAYWLARPDAAAAMAARGRARVLRDHTIGQRVREMLSPSRT